MNKTLLEAKQLITEIASGLKDISLKNTGVIIAPPFPYLTECVSLFNGIHGGNLSVASQNCSGYDNGAYTGEVSAQILDSVGVKYVIIGHSERRIYFNESDEDIRLKIKSALKNNLTPIFCVGENIDQRNANQQKEIIRSQLMDVLSAFSKEEITKCIIAYEPVWAIGTGITATSLQAQEMHAFIRLQLETVTGEGAADIPILYGGSCNAENAKELFSCFDVDGGLIGGASLKGDSFLSIIRTLVSLQ